MKSHAHASRGLTKEVVELVMSANPDPCDDFASAMADGRGGERHGHVAHPDHERGRRRLVADQLHAAIHAAVEQVHDRLLVDRRLPPRALGKLQHARAASGACYPAAFAAAANTISIWRFRYGQIFE